MKKGIYIKKGIRLCIAIPGSIIVLALAVLLVAQIVLSPSVCTSIITKYAPRYIDGNLSMSKAYVSVFRRFPAVTADIDDFVLTYPSSTFPEDSIRYGGPVSAGLSDDVADGADTLASFSRFSVSINPFRLINGVVGLKNVVLEHPRVFIRRYNDGSSNLDVIRMGGGSEESGDSSASSVPCIVLRRLTLKGNTHILYVSEPDSLSATLLMKGCRFNGRLSLRTPERGRVNFELDSLLTFGHFRQDTLLFDLDYLSLNGHRGSYKVDADAKTYLAIHRFGRLRIPLSCNGLVKVVNDERLEFGVKDFNMDVSSIHVDADLDACIGDNISLCGKISVPPVDCQAVIDDFASNFYRDASKIHTDARLSASAEVNGVYDARTSSLPELSVKLDLPRCRLSYDGIPVTVYAALQACASAAQGGPLNVEVPAIKLNAEGLSVDVGASMKDMLGEDPSVNVDAVMSASLSRMNDYLSSLLKMNLSGNVDMTVSGKFKTSQMNIYSLGNADLKAILSADNIRIASFDDSLSVFMDKLALKTGLMEDRFGKKSYGGKLLGASVHLDTLHLLSKGQMHVRGKGIKLFAQSSPQKVKVSDELELHPMRASLSMGHLFLEGEDSLSLRLTGSRNRLQIYPVSSTSGRIPVVVISGNSERLGARMGMQRYFISGLVFDAKGQKNTVDRKALVRHFRDSLYRRHPTWSRDIRLDLGESFRKYFTQWNVSGSVSMKGGGILTPIFPLRTRVTDFKGSFDNNHLSLDTLRILSGDSELEMNGTVGNLRNVLVGNGRIMLSANMNTDTLALTQLLSAYARGQRHGISDAKKLDAISDEQYQNYIETNAEDKADTLMSAIVIPGNLNARLNLNGRRISYSNLNVDSLSSVLTMKDRCLQLSGTKASTSVGNVYLDAFYSTRSKQSLLTGFDLVLEDVDAGKVISMIPDVDTLFPILKSFDGKFNCNFAATSRIDTNMNILPTTIDGIIRITGNDLAFNNNRQVTRIARMLLIRNPENTRVDSLTIEGVVKDNVLEIFPCVLNVDKWSLAVAGVQNLEKSYNYNVSIAKSPLLFRLGADISGDSFDSPKIKIGRPKYNRFDVPSFSEVIDTTRINLVSSIRNVFERGVERAYRENRSGGALKRERARKRYERSVALEPMDSLGVQEKHMLDSLTRQSQPDSLTRR